MQKLIFLLLVGFAATELTSEYVCVHNTQYKKEVLKENVSGPYQMVIDHDTNTLFFSYAARADEFFKIAYLSLKTANYGLVSGIRGGFATAVDSLSQTVYMGGENGVYKFDYETKAATYLGIPKNRANIWQMFYSDGLYFTTYPDEKPYLYKDGVVVGAPGVTPNRAMVIAASKAGNIYYANSSGLFEYNKVSEQTIQLDETLANGFSTDVNGNLYFSAPNGIYYINEKDGKIEKILNLDNCYGLAIEGNSDIIYSQSESITRLKRTVKDCVDEDKHV